MFERKLQSLRLRRGISQSQLARHIGVSREAVSCYEKGKYKPSFRRIINLANFFGVSTDYLLGEEEGEAPQPNLHIVKCKYDI